MTRTVSYVMSQGVATDEPPDALMTTGKVEGAELRPTPAIEALWTSTFNLRWWDHLVVDRQTSSPPAKTAAGRARIRPTA